MTGKPDQPAAAPFEATGNGVRVFLRVSPRAARDRCDGIVGDNDRTALRIAVTAPPDGGRANDAVVALLAKEWRVPKSRMTLVAGRTSRRKTLMVTGDPPRLTARLNEWLTARLNARLMGRQGSPAAARLETAGE